MNEIDKTNFTFQTKFRLNEISKIENYFNQEINMLLIVLPATCGGLCIVSSVSVAGAAIGITGAIFIFIFSLTTGIMKKIAEHNKKQKKKHDQILMLAKSKLNSIGTFVSQVLKKI